MSIFLRQLYKEPPRIWGSFQDRQYSIWRNLEDIYGIDHKSEILIMPLYWGLPPLDYSKFGNHGINHGAIYKNRNLGFNGTSNYIEVGQLTGEITGADPRTISFWFSADVFGTDTDRTLVTYADGVAGRGIWIFAEDNAISVGFAQHRMITPKTVLLTGTWYYITIVVPDGAISTSDILIYIDGINQSLSTEAGSPQTLNTDNTNVKIGSDQVPSNYYDGLAIDVHISDIAYTSGQVALFHDHPWDLYRPVNRPVSNKPTYIQKLIEGKYDLLLQKTGEAKYDIQLQKLNEAKYDIQLQKIIESKYDIHVQKIIEALYDILAQKTTEAKYDILLQKLNEAKYDILLQKLNEAKYDILLQETVEAKYDILFQKAVESLYDIIVQKIVENKYDIQIRKIIEGEYDILVQKIVEAFYDIVTEEFVKKLLEAKYDILLILRTIEMQSIIQSIVNLDSEIQTIINFQSTIKPVINLKSYIEE